MAALDGRRVPSGNAVLDEGLGGGFREGSLVLVEGESGAGATEFVLGVAADAARGRKVTSRFATGLRAPERAAREARDLLGETAAASIRFCALGNDPARTCQVLLEGLGRGDVLVVESTSTFGSDLPLLTRQLGDLAAASGAVVLLLHAPGTLPARDEAGVRDACDACVSFTWKDGGLARRRLMALSKMRGLAPMLETDDVPVFEVALRHGIGIGVSRVKAVL